MSKGKTEIYLEGLPRWKNENCKSTRINWNKVKEIKPMVKFIYKNIKGKIQIIDYERNKKQHLTIKYNNKEFDIQTSAFVSCKLGGILGERTSEFKIKIGTRYKDENRDITIIDKQYIKDKNGGKRKYYKFKCNNPNCGFDGGRHWDIRDKQYKEGYWLGENNLKSGNGCACCANRIVVEGINDVPTKALWMVRYFQGGYEEAKKYSCQSNKKIYPICPDCGRIKDKEISISDIYNRHSIGCSCNDGNYYPEKFFNLVLQQLDVNYKTQLSKATFKWCDKYRYDFYFEYKGEKYIVETHGRQHYEQTGRKGKRARTLEKEQENDKLKKQLALDNGIKEENYIVIDARESNLEWIRDNENGILNSKLSKLFDLNKIDWNKCEEFALSNRVKEICEYKRNNPKMTTGKIKEITGISQPTITKYLKHGTELGWVNYDPKEETKKQVAIFKNGVKLGEYASCSELERSSEKDFGVKLLNSKISAVCRGKRNHHKGFTFKYIDIELHKQELVQAS
jgi:hypothetical protein